MTTGIRLVAPFRPFPPESDLHLSIPDFDWPGALAMLVDTASRACACPVHIITDVDTTLAVPTLQYETQHRRLMLWTLEACVAYLASDDFDRDTVMLDCDQLVFEDLARYFAPGTDLGILIRTTDKHLESGRTVLNGVQFWSHRAKARLVAFYRKALSRAQQLPEESIRWGADTQALVDLLQPLAVGTHRRAGLVVAMREAKTILETLTSRQMDQLDAGRPLRRYGAVLDFRYTRKRYMRRAYEAALETAAGVA